MKSWRGNIEEPSRDKMENWRSANHARQQKEARRQNTNCATGESDLCDES